jgi:hypothetical protein
MMKILRICNPDIELLIDRKKYTLNVPVFLSSIIDSPSSPYLNILDPENFSRVYATENQLIWEQILEATACSGETQRHDVVFSEKEIKRQLEI